MTFTDVALTTMFAIAVSTSIVAEDGADLYKKRCSGCHCAGGEGKSTIKAPALKGTKLEASQIVEHTTKGEPNSKPPHNKAITGLNGNCRVLKDTEVGSR